MDGRILRAGEGYEACNKTTKGEKRQRTQPVEIEGVSVRLVKDAPLHRFMSALRRKPHTARATLIGVFFAGQREQPRAKPTLPGYGHLGCCTLLVIEKVESVPR